MFARLLSPPARSFFLLGPRGTGKSTWLRAHFPDARTVDLLDEALYQRYLADHGAFARDFGDVRRGDWVVVDEVQRLPWVLNEAHRAIEGRGLRFALTGSSARKLHQSGVNLLAGRAVRRTMYPLAPEEIGARFDLRRALRWGTLPLVYGATDADDVLASYARLYLKEEIQAEALVRNLPGFARFLPIAARFHGQTLNVAGLARDAGVSRTTVADYVGVLEDTLLAYRLPAYESALRVRERRHPKLFWVDPGVVRAVAGLRGEPTPEHAGHLFEGLVLMLLRLYAELGRLEADTIAYWSPAESQQTEVDFVLSHGRSVTALEVKHTTRLRDEHFRGLRAIEGLRGLRRRVVVHAGREDGRSADGIDILGWPSFTAALAEGTLLG